MENQDWTDNLSIEDLPNEELKLIATYCGMDIALNLIKNLPGITVNIPKFAFKKLVKQYILKNCDGSKFNRQELALKFGVSEQFVYNLMKTKN